MKANNLIFAVVAFCAMPTDTVEASCADNPPCQAAWQADAVFVGTVVGETLEPIGTRFLRTVNAIAVTRVYHGKVPSVVTVVPTVQPSPELERLAQPGGRFETFSTVDVRFEMGREYVVYATRLPDGRWRTSACAGSKRIDDAAADLSYLARVSDGWAKSTITGRIDKVMVDPGTGVPDVVPAAGVPVSIASGRRRTIVITDADGVVDVEVPPGDYTVSPAVPETVLVVGGASSMLSVPRRGCAPFSFFLTSSARIEGRVVRPDGTPVSGATVDAVRAGVATDPDELLARSATTDRAGRFELDEVQPGRYVIGVNLRRGPSVRSPYLATAYNGTTVADAEPVEVAPGARKRGFTIVITPLPLVAISGTVLSNDGRPVIDAYVVARPIPGEDVTSFARTDNWGRFELKVLVGPQYLVRASVRNDTHTATTNVYVNVVPETGPLLLVMPSR